MENVKKVHDQILDYCKSIGLPVVHYEPDPTQDGESGPSMEPIRKCFAAAFFTQVAISTEDGSGTFTTLIDQKEVLLCHDISTHGAGLYSPTICPL